ncbi:MAG TPA: hypothetical protein VF628_05580 [Allosphingosinicella sp.]|jgi:hypothetical protein
MKERNLLLAVAALVIVIAAAFALASPRENRLKTGEEPRVETAARETGADRPRRLPSQLCASSAGYQQLKSAAFEQAIRVRGEPASLTRLAATSVIRMENPVATSEDGDDFATCSGRLVIELPPGAERGAGGQRRLAADVGYTAQRDAAGGIAYRLTGGDAIVSSLAAFDIETSLQPAPAAPPAVEVAQAPDPAQDLPVIIRADPADRPAPRPAPARPAPPPKAERDEPAPRPAPARPAPAARAERDEPVRREPPLRPSPARAERSARPSFNCASAGSRSERAICGSERLAAKDRQMSRLFFSALNDADPRTRAELQRTRNRFLSYRERCRSDECIAEAYDGRMGEIRDIMEGAE